MDELEEIWKEIPDFPDYKVSNLGNLLSYRTMKTRILRGHKKISTNSIGEKRIERQFTLCKPKPSTDSINITAANLVLWAFTGERGNNEKNVVYKNGNTLDAKLNNIEYYVEKKFYYHEVISEINKLCNENNIYTKDFYDVLLKAIKQRKTTFNSISFNFAIRKKETVQL